MTITNHANSLKKIKLIDRILVEVTFSFNEKVTSSENSELTAQEFRNIIKGRRPRMVGKSLQNL